MTVRLPPAFAAWILLVLLSVARERLSQCQCVAATIAFTPRPASAAARQKFYPRSQWMLSNPTIIRADDIEIPIIYENDVLLAIDKPPGVPHHNDPSTGQLGILSLIRVQQQRPNSSFPYQKRLYGVHRLDRVTSGILILAKNPGTAGALMEKFRRREVSKIYLAVSGRKPKKKQGWVRGEMVRGRRGSYKLGNSADGAKAVTSAAGAGEINGKGKKERGGYAVTRFFTAGLGNTSPASSLLCGGKSDHAKNPSSTIPRTAILFRPRTGRTHQVRVAVKSLAMPILGDVRYGGGRVVEASEDDVPEGEASRDRWDRTYLHAAGIHFRLDDDDADVTIWSPPPFDHLFSAPMELTNVFMNLMEKHCDCLPVLVAAREAAVADQGA